MRTVLLLLSVLGTTPLGAQVRFAPAEVDLGEILQQEARRLEFTVTNDGDSKIGAAGLSLACGCLVLIDGPAELAPGARATLVAELRTATMTGAQVKDILWTSAAGQGRARLRFSVLADFRMEPPMLQLGALTRGGRKEGQIEIVARPGLAAELAILQVPVGVEAKLEIVPVSAGQARRWRLDVVRSAAPKARAGAFEDAIMIEARGARVPGLTAGLAGYVEGAIGFRPETIDFGRIESGKSGLAKFRLESGDGRDFRVLGLAEGRGLALVEVPAAAASSHDLAMTLEAGLPPGTARGFILVELDHPEEKTLRLPWRARIIEKSP